MKDSELKYCICTEATDKTFAYLRVMLNSFVTNNKWFNGNIVVLVNDLTPLSSENRSILSSMHPNIEFKRINHAIYANVINRLDTRNKAESVKYIQTLYAAEAFALSEYDFVLYINHLSMIINDLSRVFLNDADLVGTIDSYQFPIEVATRKTDKQYVINTGIMLLSKSILKSNMATAIKDKLLTLKALQQSTISTIISDIIARSEFKLKLLNSKLYAKKSCFPDSKTRIFNLHKNSICAIDLDMGVYNKVKNDSRFRFNDINKMWIRYNSKLDEYYNADPNEVNTKRIQLSKYKNAIEARTVRGIVARSSNAASNSIAPVIKNKINDIRVSVLISAFGCVDFIEDCLDSIDNQTKSAHRILIGIDACVDTLNKIKSISHKYHNLEVFYSDINTGPYKVMNSLIQNIPDNEFFITFGADDKMHCNLIETMSISESAKISRHDGVLYIQKKQFDKIGGYRPWRCAADTDMIFRLRKKIGAVHRIEILYERGIHNNQLTKSNSLSNLRNSYISIIQENEKSKNPTIVIQPEFNKLTKIDIDKKLISVNMATYPARQYSFKPCMEKMLKYESIDKFRIYLNEFTEIPADFPKDSKIEYVIGLPNIKDTGKFHWAYENKNEYYFTVDDDIFYPESFFTEHINALKKYNGEILVTIHGKRVPPIPKNFHDTLKPAYHCLKHCPDDVWVHIGGTGVMAFDNSKFKLPNDLIKSHGMCDLWMAVYAQHMNMPILCRKHLAGHILAIDIENKDTLFEKRHEMWNDQIKVLQSVVWKLNIR